MFMLCDVMKWNHLPESGGIYDQNPKLVDRFYYIFQERAKQQLKEDEERSRKNSGPTPRNGPPVAGRRRR